MATESAKNWVPVATLSFVMHAALLGVCAWFFQHPLAVNIVAAGEGQGGVGESIEVSTVDGKTLGFKPFTPVSTVGEDANAPNNVDVATKTSPPDSDADVLPSTQPTPPPKDRETTNRPTIDQSSQLVSQTPLRGSSSSASVQIGPSSGSPIPSMTAGVGIPSGVNLSGNDVGVPGGSAYGRLIQGILARNYNPPVMNDVSGTQFVIVQLRIARDGRILSVVNGRVAPNYFKKRSGNNLINNAVERAVIAANAQGLPAFPNGFLMGAQEAVAEVWFKYPK